MGRVDGDRLVDAVAEHREQRSEVDGSIVAVQTHHDDIYDVSVTGAPAGSTPPQA